jgi:hypothetical protein
MQKFRAAFILLALAFIAAGGSTRLQEPWDIAAAVVASVMGAASLLLFAVQRTVGSAEEYCAPLTE